MHPNQKSSEIITNEELEMIRDYILLPHMEKMVQKSIDEAQYSTNILKRLYILASQKILNQIIQDMIALRRELKKRNIRVLDEEQSDFIIFHKYYCRGYKDQFAMTRDVMRAEISVQLTKYMSELARLLKAYSRETK